MPVVTALRAASRGRIAVFVDDERLCTVSEALVARWRLFKGRELDIEALTELMRQASAEGVMADAHRLLAHRARSREELSQRLLRKGHDEAAIAVVLERLAVDGLVDDAVFARSFVADKRRLSGWGSRRIERGLTELGVPAAIIAGALERPAGAGEPHDERGRARAVLAKLGPPRPPLEAARRRAYQVLLRRGFTAEVAYGAVKQWSAAAAYDADRADSVADTPAAPGDEVV